MKYFSRKIRYISFNNLDKIILWDTICKRAFIDMKRISDPNLFAVMNKVSR